MICKDFSDSQTWYYDLQFKVIEMFLGAGNPKVITLSNFTVFVSSLINVSQEAFKPHYLDNIFEVLGGGEHVNPKIL